MAYIFGGNTGLTYEDIQKRRAIAEQLRTANASTPRNVGEGLHAIARGLVSRAIEKQTSRQDAENRAAFNAKWGTLFGGQRGASTAPTAASPVNFNPAAPENIAADTMAALGKGGKLSPNMVVAELTARGLPEHIAKAFAMNFQDESGLDPAINEQNPTVPGSRGGFGLAQWTGPRREALEAFAAQRGVPASNPDVQFDFLMQELQGPEAGAARAILSAQDTPTAAAAIVNQFLRPAETHRASREADYLGGAIPAQMDIGTLAEIMGDPYASEGQKAIIQALLGQQLGAMDPMRQMELEKAQLEIEGLRNPQPEAPKPTDDMREYEFAKSQGFTGSFEEWQVSQKRAGATSINLGGGSDKQIFDEVKASADAARAALTGLNALREAEKALNDPNGAITGFAANQRLSAAKLGALMGITDPAVISNTETFRAAIAPQVAAMMKATVGSTQISNADRDFAEKAAGGAITLDETSIKRLLDIMTKASNAVIERHTGVLDSVYPDGQGFDRERALFGIVAPGPDEVDFSKMTAADIGNVDIDSLDAAGLAALEARMKELGL